METIVIVVSIVVTVGLVVWFAATSKHPENASSHEPSGRTTSRALQGEVHDRPAGPGAEADGVAGRGEPAPGPSADSLDVVDPSTQARRGSLEP